MDMGNFSLGRVASVGKEAIRGSGSAQTASGRTSCIGMACHYISATPLWHLVACREISLLNY